MACHMKKLEVGLRRLMTIERNIGSSWLALYILQYELDYIKSGHENKGKNRLQDNSLENLKLVVVY